MQKIKITFLLKVFSIIFIYSCSNRYWVHKDLMRYNIYIEDYLNYTIQHFEQNTEDIVDCRNKYLFGDSSTIINKYLNTNNPYDIRIGFEDNNGYCGRYLSKGYSIKDYKGLNLTSDSLIETGLYKLNLKRYGKDYSVKLSYSLYQKTITIDNKKYDKVIYFIGDKDFKKLGIDFKSFIFIPLGDNMYKTD